MKSAFGFADYLLYPDRNAVGAVEAKAAGTLTGVEAQLRGQVRCVRFLVGGVLPSQSCAMMLDVLASQS